MPNDPRSALAHQILLLVPEDGSTVGNIKLLRLISKQLDRNIDDDEYALARDYLVNQGLLAKGRGRGGSVYRVSRLDDRPSLELESQEVVPAKTQPTPKARRGGKRTGGRSGKKDGSDAKDLIAYQHDEKRVNNPEVGMVTPDSDADEGKTGWTYDPHIDPALQFDVGRTHVENLIDDALASGDEAVMRQALEQLRREAGPYLNWAGKAERSSFAVDTVSLHVHERIDPSTILRAIRKRMTKKGEERSSQSDLFQAWFEAPLPYREAIEFYKHDRGWANRLIAGDSLQVMNSLLLKEGMVGQVQMIYFDPPYGIKYGSNFQPFVDKRTVKDRKDEDLTQQPEMLKAFRDTWELGIHSYLSYLRDRFWLARDLLTPEGSILVQISDENVHLVRSLLDEIFEPENFLAEIAVVKTSGLAASDTLASSFDYLLWYSRDRSRVKFRPLFFPRENKGEGLKPYTYIIDQDGRRRRLTKDERASPQSRDSGRRYRFDNLTKPGPGSKYVVDVNGESFTPGSRWWGTTPDGMRRLERAGRLAVSGSSLWYVKHWADFPLSPYNNLWTDTASSFMSDKIYVVQTTTKILERCLLMTTDPGDLVFDPTCGSGTTAFVAEQWGRRWMTCDTSRVAVTLAKQRLMTASFDYYELKYPHEGLSAGFIYKSVPHVTMKTIANNPDIDDIYNRQHPMVLEALGRLNMALLGANPPVSFLVTAGARKGSELKLEGSTSLEEWEVPFDFPPDWPESGRLTFGEFHSARKQMQDDIDAAISAHADQEVLYDQVQVSTNKLRISGPFTVEAVPFPSVLALDEHRHPHQADATIARSGESARQHDWRDELLKTGIRAQEGRKIQFADLEPIPGTRYLHCIGNLAQTGETVVVSFGPEHAALEQRQVELAMREAGEVFPRPKMIVFAAFTFDPEAAKDIDATRGIRAVKAQMNTDLLTEDLKKARASNESFWLMGQPDVEVRQLRGGRYEVEVHGFDYFDSVNSEIVSGGKQKIASWSLDTDYDERSLFPRQVFFPMAGKKDGWNALTREIKEELNEAHMAKLHSTVSLPFEAGEFKKIAVKIIDNRGIESLKVIPLD